MIDEHLLSILACPKCKGVVVYIEEKEKSPEYLDCAKCRLRYPIKNKIPVMLVDEAKSYS